MQEVTPEFLPILRAHELMDHYECSDDFSGHSVFPYGVLTLAKKFYQPTYEFFQLPTEMDRSLLLTKLILHDEAIAIGNIHLESLSNPELRQKQLEVSKHVMSKSYCIQYLLKLNLLFLVL